MIKFYYEEDLTILLGVLFTYGLNHNYSCKAIEERILKSSLINELELNRFDPFLSEEKVVSDTYGVNVSEADLDIDCLFYAQSYLKLFFHQRKSFEYLFLYWPLEHFVDKYAVYHEMDYTNLERDFLKRTKNEPLLKKLCIERDIQITEASKLTGINLNTLKKYSRDDKQLYGATHQNIYRLSMLFGVKENIFAERLLVFFDEEALFSNVLFKDVKNALGFFFACYYDKRIKEVDFKYDEKNDEYISKGPLKLVVLSPDAKDFSFEYVNQYAGENTYIVLLPIGSSFNEKTDYSFLKQINAFEILVLKGDSVEFIKKSTKREITETINRSLLLRANETFPEYN